MQHHFRVLIFSLMAVALFLLLLLSLSSESAAQGIWPGTPQPDVRPAQQAALPAPDHDCTDGYCVFEVITGTDDAGPHPTG